MDPLTKRILLFTFGCIPIRTLFVYIATTPYKRHLAYALIFPMIGFLYLYFTNTRNTGMETFGQPIWWKELRILHASLYAWYIINVFLDQPCAYIPLALDVMIGAVAFLMHHFV